MRKLEKKNSAWKKTEELFPKGFLGKRLSQGITKLNKAIFQEAVNMGNGWSKRNQCRTKRYEVLAMRQRKRERERERESLEKRKRKGMGGSYQFNAQTALIKIKVSTFQFSKLDFSVRSTFKTSLKIGGLCSYVIVHMKSPPSHSFG